MRCRSLSGQIASYKNIIAGVASRRCVGNLRTDALLAKVTTELILHATGIDLDAPWSHRRAAEWDNITFGAWLRTACDGDASTYNFIVLLAESDLSTSVDNVSLLHVLFMAKTGGGVVNGLFALNQVKRLKQGGGAPARKMASELGDRVRYGTHAASIKQDGQTVEVTDQAGTRCTRYASSNARFDQRADRSPIAA